MNKFQEKIMEELLKGDLCSDFQFQKLKVELELCGNKFEQMKIEAKKLHTEGASLSNLFKMVEDELERQKNIFGMCCQKMLAWYQNYCRPVINKRVA